MYRHMKQYWFLALLLAAFVAGCNDNGGGGVPLDTTPPTVLSTQPANGDHGVATNSTVTATFSEAMKVITITTTTFTLQQGTTPVTGTVMYAGTTATFTPAVPLAVSTTYTATIHKGPIPTGVHDLVCNTLVSDYVWSFTTAPTPAPQYALTVDATHGSVTKVLDQLTYSAGSVVTLTATPATDYHFTGWSDDLSGTTSPAQITMTEDKTVTANFAINTYTLSVNAVNGSVTKSPDQMTYDAGTVVTLTAFPAADYSFAGWSGDLGGSVNPVQITMSTDKTVTATFTDQGDLGLTVN